MSAIHAYGPTVLIYTNQARKVAVLCEQAIVHVMPCSQSTADNSLQVVSQKCRVLCNTYIVLLILSQLQGVVDHEEGRDAQVDQREQRVHPQHTSTGQGERSRTITHTQLIQYGTHLGWAILEITGTEYHVLKYHDI